MSRRGFLFPVKALSMVFRGKFLAALARALGHGRLALSGSTTALAEPCAQRTFLVDLRKHSRVVYAKRPFAGPQQLLEYLGRYTHRTALSNERLVSCDARSVRFRYKDTAHGARRRVMALAALEFLRRFALHVLPRGFNRIRHYGLLANRNKRALLRSARAALGACAPPAAAVPPESATAFWQRVADIARCPRCRLGTFRVVATPPRNRVGLRDAGRLHLLQLHRRAAASTRSMATLASAPRVDPPGPLCHSALIANRASPRATHHPCTPRRAPRSTRACIQSPSTTACALIPAVQSN